MSTRPRTLAEWLSHQERVHSRSIDLGLERIRCVLTRLQWRAPPAPVITIAGTNGKGSVASYCDAILRAAHRKVGLFTSPHLVDYRERIRIDGECVEADALCAAFERIEAARGDVGITFFEYSTLAALLLFSDACVDAYVLEVGLGGRLDAVNAIDADVGVVVSIGLDHQEYLGSSLNSIGREKAGIFRRGKAAVLGSTHMPASVEQTAIATGARLVRLGQEFSHRANASGEWAYRGPAWQLDELPPPALFGRAQYDNAATALAALEAASEPLIEARAVRKGLAEVSLPARFERLETTAEDPAWIVDVAHNAAAASVLARNLQSTRIRGRTLAIFGALLDKDARGIAMQVAPCADAWFLCATPSERGCSAQALLARIADVIGAATLCDSLDEACARALAAAHARDRIVIFGSFLIAGPALEWIRARKLASRAVDSSVRR